MGVVDRGEYSKCKEVVCDCREAYLYSVILGSVSPQCDC